MNRQRLIEWGKTLIIIALTVSAIMLSGVSEIIGQVFGVEPLSASVDDNADQNTQGIQQAAKPLTIMITTAENAHYGVKYNGEALNEAYSWFTAGLGEALGSSGEPVEVGREQWESALHGSGVYFDYLYEQSLSSLAQWMGVNISAGASLHTARRLCLAVEDASVVLYYIRALDGKAYRCETALSSSGLQSRLAGYVPNGAMFIFETGDVYNNIDPYYCVLSKLSEASELTVANPLQDIDGVKLLPSFEMNGFVANQYVESDGEIVFVEGNKSLRISPEGEVLYSCLDPKQEVQPIRGTPGVIAKAYALIESLPCSAGWEIQMSHISFDSSTNEYTVRFEYLINGVVVCFDGRQSAFEIVISNGAIVRADMLCRSYSASGSIIPMPELQALAIVSKLGGGEPMLAYTDDGENVGLGWVTKN